MRKETERLRVQIMNEADEVAQNATAQSTLLTANAKVEAKKIVEDARTSGLEILYKTLGITEEKHRKALDYVRTLQMQDNANIYVGFQTMVAKPEK